MLHELLNMMTGVFTLPASIFCSADHRDLGLDILEDTAIVDVMDGITAFTDFKGLFPIQLMADDSVGHFFGLLVHWHTGHQEGHCCDLVAILSTRDNMRHSIMAAPSVAYFSYLHLGLYFYFCSFLAKQSE